MTGYRFNPILSSAFNNRPNVMRQITHGDIRPTAISGSPGRLGWCLGEHSCPGAEVGMKEETGRSST